MSIAISENPVSSSTFGNVLAVDDDEKPPRSGEGRVRLPNKTQWALRDILDAAQKERALMEDIVKWIEREQALTKNLFDSARLNRLLELSNMVTRRALRIGEIERMASDARMGIYEPRLVPTEKTRTHAKQ